MPPLDLSEVLLRRIVSFALDSQEHLDQQREIANSACCQYTHEMWAPNDPAVQGLVVGGAHVDSAFESSSEFAIYQYLVATRTSVHNSNMLLRIIKDPAFNPLAIRYKSVESLHSRMALANEYGISFADLHENIDGDQRVDYYFRESVDVSNELMLCHAIFAQCTTVFSPTYDPVSKERTYSEFMGAGWAEHADAALNMPGRFACPFALGSDGTQIKNRDSAHPIYFSILWASNALRQSHLCWRLLGFVPVLDHDRMFTVDSSGRKKKASSFEIARRERQLFHQCIFLVLRKSIQVHQDSGRLVLCGDGVVRRVVDILALWITDRQEHELILWWQEHMCFHCDCRKEDRDTPGHFTCPHSTPHNSESVDKQVMLAALHGTYE